MLACIHTMDLAFKANHVFVLEIEWTKVDYYSLSATVLRRRRFAKRSEMYGTDVEVIHPPERFSSIMFHLRRQVVSRRGLGGMIAPIINLGIDLSPGAQCAHVPGRVQPRAAVGRKNVVYVIVIIFPTSSSVPCHLRPGTTLAPALRPAPADRRHFPE